VALLSPRAVGLGALVSALVAERRSSGCWYGWTPGFGRRALSVHRSGAFGNPQVKACES
jgi:hypothetical protein